MRNLLQYPVTKSEIVECLRKESEAARNAEIIGDMRPYLLKKAADVIASLPEDEVNELVRIKRNEPGKTGVDAGGVLSFGS